MRAIFVISVFISFFGWTVSQNSINDMKNLPKYDSRYDYLDVDAILDSKRLVKNYVDCLINSVRCTPEGKALKRILPEALRTKCIRCTERQKKTAVKVIKRLKNEYPIEWAKLSARWDPTGDFSRYFENFLAGENSNSIPSNEAESPGPESEEQPPPRPESGRPAASTSSPKPAILNRFGEDGEPMSGGQATPEPEPGSPPKTTRPMTWTLVDVLVPPTRFPLHPVVQDNIPTFSTAMTIIDQIGYKIIRTTELVTDILRNTVRAVVG